MVFNLRQTEVLGLDIGSSTVKIIQLSKDSSGYAVIAAGIIDISQDQIDKELNTVRAIGKCLELTGVQTKFAVCSVCGTEVAVRDFEFPSLPPGEIEGAVLLEASQVCPFNIQDGRIDYQSIPKGDNKTCGVLVAATNAIIKSKIQLVQEATLDW